jgi:O6-methylguanine-DNA--protein-cysteine methyltransferase
VTRSNGRDPLLHGLATLTTQPPRELADLVYANWLSVPSPAGQLRVAFTSLGISYVRLEGNMSAFQRDYGDRFQRPLRPSTGRPPAGLLPTLRGRPVKSLQLDLRELTPFEVSVLQVVRRIPRRQVRPLRWVIGELRANGEASDSTDDTAVLEVLAENPFPLIVPCHRVITSQEPLGDYVLGPGLKERLLRAEDVNLDEIRALAANNVFFLGSNTTHIVCLPSCAHARQITRPHRRHFSSIREAEEAGYRGCRHCRPTMVESA